MAYYIMEIISNLLELWSNFSGGSANLGLIFLMKYGTEHAEHPWTWLYLLEHIDGLVQERCNSSALAMELRLSCTNPLIGMLCFTSHEPQCSVV